MRLRNLSVFRVDLHIGFLVPSRILYVVYHNLLMVCFFLLLAFNWIDCTLTEHILFFYLGLPPLVSRRILEILTYLATNHFSVSNLLFYFDSSSLAFKYPSSTLLDQTVNKGKEKISDAMVTSNLLDSSLKEHRPLLLFLKLLNRPLFLRSSVHLEQAC